eukprot:CAMPEP_0198454114 /NCGR_PEP_ID=MMETSP1453-20131121/10914_1 /TAXON_ID=1461543 ORGANISM="Unidentified sp., Strain RCC701" /NCGR_SAMPLE_ID=MMETSP1453 /ASSEMBLY_ACC=CAM_ASM_001118 /LENGTH=76 /DNA_ID=CAMNT_0044177981 /DNA_START=21 /DNA_END=248 /DNA_ORIENTATION=+
MGPTNGTCLSVVVVAEPQAPAPAQEKFHKCVRKKLKRRAREKGGGGRRKEMDGGGGGGGDGTHPSEEVDCGWKELG